MTLSERFKNHIRDAVSTAVRDQGDYSETANGFVQHASAEIVQELATFGARDSRVDAIIRVAAKRELKRRDEV